jgi:hypothetical protein
MLHAVIHATAHAVAIGIGYSFLGLGAGRLTQVAVARMAHPVLMKNTDYANVAEHSDATVRHAILGVVIILAGFVPLVAAGQFA